MKDHLPSRGGGNDIGWYIFPESPDTEGDRKLSRLVAGYGEDDLEWVVIIILVIVLSIKQERKFKMVTTMNKLYNNA